MPNTDIQIYKKKNKNKIKTQKQIDTYHRSAEIKRNTGFKKEKVQNVWGNMNNE